MAKPNPAQLALSFLILLFPFLTVGCGSGPSPAASIVPPDVQFVLSDNGSLYLVHGDGSAKKEIVGGGYAQPALSPDKTKVACVQPGDPAITVYSLGPQFEPEGRPKSIVNSDAMHASGEIGKAYSPVWSADGNKIYFLNNNHLVAYDYQAQHTTVILDFPEDQSGRSLSQSLSNPDHSLYAILQDKGGAYSLWSADLAASQAVSLAPFDKDALSQSLPSLSDDAVQSLFGSREDPVSDPVVIPGGRFYFYVGKKEGDLLRSDWVLGYDKVQKTKFEVIRL